MAKDQKEWFRQADYDMGAAQTMFDGERYVYTVFMRHLSIEKALKSLYFKKYGEQAPKTHNLGFLSEKNGLEFPEHLDEFISKLNLECVVTRYPDDIRRISRNYNKKNTKEIIAKGKEALEWLREKL